MLACLANDIDQASSARADLEDYERLIAFALRHEVVGELAQFAKRNGMDLPEALAAALETYMERLRARNRRLGRESVALAETLAQLGVPAILAKGAVWNGMFRDPETPRSSNDIDVYLDAADIRGAVERIVEAYGGVAYDPLDDTLRHLHHHSFWAPGAEAAIELHWDVAGPWHNLRFDLPGAIARSRIVSLEFGEMRTLRADDAILFCALELSKESWASLKKLVDFAAAVRQGGSEALDAAEAAAESLGCSRMLHISLTLAFELGFLGHADSGFRQLAGDPVAARVTTQSLRRLAREGYPPSLRQRVIEGLTLSRKHDWPRDQAYHLWRIILLYRLRGWLGAKYR